MTPEANPSNAFCTNGFISCFRKNTHPAPNVVPRKGRSNPIAMPMLKPPFFYQYAPKKGLLHENIFSITILFNSAHLVQVQGHTAACLTLPQPGFSCPKTAFPYLGEKAGKESLQSEPKPLPCRPRIPQG